MIYFILFVFILFFGVFDFYPVSKLNKLFFVCFIGFVLILVGGLRWETGTDWNSYYNFFTNNYIYDDFISSEFEYLYSILAFTIKQLSQSYTVFLLFFCFLTISLKLYGFCKISDYNFIFLTILLYYANQLGDVSANRQSLAMSFALIGFYFIINKRLILFIITTYVAFLFHTSAIVFFLAIPLIYADITRKKLILFILLGFCIGLFITSTGTNSLIFNLLIGGEGHIASKISVYQEINEIGNSSTGSAIDPKISYILGLSRRSLVLIPALLFYDKLSLAHKNFKILINMYVFGSLIYLIFSPIIQVLNRLSSYFDLAEFFILPLFITLPKQKYIRIFIYTILVLFAFAKFYSTIMSFWTYYTPYKLCF